MPKNTWVNVAGTWREVQNVWMNVGGVWKQKVVPKGNINGTWKEFMQYILYLDFLDFSVIYKALTATVEITSDFIRILPTDKDGHLLVGAYVGTVQRLNLSDYNTLSVDMMSETNGQALEVIISRARTTDDSYYEAIVRTDLTQNQLHTAVLDVSSFTGDYYIIFRSRVYSSIADVANTYIYSAALE